MPDRPLKLHDLRRILRRYGVSENESLGKGSHTTFHKTVNGQYTSYPIPRHGNEVIRIYVSGLRKRFHLRSADGVSDHDFYA